MNKKLIALAVTAGLAMPGFANAVEVAGKALEIYGKAHISIDSVSAKDATNASVDNMSISANSSRLGFKGEGEVGSMTGFYLIEANIKTDESGGNIDHRGAYVGLKGSFGSALVGYKDTPYKGVRGKFDVFGDTVGDSRAIMGVTTDGAGYTDSFNVRAKNVLMYSIPKNGGLSADIMYSTSYNGTADQGQDNNDTSLISADVMYKGGPLVVAAAYEEHKLGTGNGKEKGTRVVAAYKMGFGSIGLMYENLDHDTDLTARRDAYGVSAAFNAGPGKIKLQYVKANDNEAISDSGADEIAVGYDYKLAKNASTYIMYSKVSNDANAAYGINGGHDSDKYTTFMGTDVSAISLGYIYKF